MRLALALSGALVATALFAGGASAHQAKTIAGTVDCHGAYSITGTADWWGDVSLIVTLRGSTIATLPGGDVTHDVRPFGPVTGTGGHPGDAIGARASDQEGGVTGELVLVGGSCDKPSPKTPSLRFLGPCGDPMHAVRFTNPTDHALTGTFHWKSATTRVWHDTKVVVKAHSSRRTTWKHVLGNSRMAARIGGVSKHTFAADPGNYRACPK